MPAQVPAGYTRGSILLLNPAPTPQSLAEQLQRFWGEAGGYGARVLILTVGQGSGQSTEIAGTYAALLREWETRTVKVELLPTRRAAQQLGIDEIERATGILLLGDDPLQMAAVLGGTAAAQGLRRANARTKALAGVAASATFLCQHMLLVKQTPALAGSVYFAPGLGAINRVAVMAPREASRLTEEQITEDLLRGVSFNPFLVGLGLTAGMGAVIYPNSTIEVFGPGSALLVDAANVDDESLFNADPFSLAPISLANAPGINIHRLAAGDTFHLDPRTVERSARTDIPRSGAPLPEP